jgi:hypothetical protein
MGSPFVDAIWWAACRSLDQTEVSTGLLEAEFFPFVGQTLDKRIDLIVVPARKCEQFML